MKKQIPQKSFVYLIIFQFVEIKQWEVWKKNQQRKKPPQPAMNENRWTEHRTESKRRHGENFVFMLHHWDDETWALHEILEHGEREAGVNKREKWNSTENRVFWKKKIDVLVLGWDMHTSKSVRLNENPEKIYAADGLMIDRQLRGKIQFKVRLASLNLALNSIPKVSLAVHFVPDGKSSSNRPRVAMGEVENAKRKMASIYTRKFAGEKQK